MGRWKRARDVDRVHGCGEVRETLRETKSYLLLTNFHVDIGSANLRILVNPRRRSAAHAGTHCRARVRAARPTPPRGLRTSPSQTGIRTASRRAYRWRGTSCTDS